ncbi:MAG: hypothetical protein IPK98_17725 [Chloracidobacterium sp.]|nr:hypothetical protein [Chloracidobacterium sp.]
MKNIPLIAVCLVAVLGCDISKYVNGVKNDNANIAKPTPTATTAPVETPKPAATPAKPGVISILKKAEGKYPYELKLLENAEMKVRLQKLMGPDFAALKANWDVESPIEIVGGILRASGCEQHNCGANMYYLFVDIENDNINIYHIKDKTQVYSEHSKIKLPKKFADELEGEE